MSTISIRLPDNFIEQIDQLSSILHLKRTEYIKKALEKMNAEVLRMQRQERLKKASLLVKVESQLVNTEFEAVAYDSEN